MSSPLSFDANPSWAAQAETLRQATAQNTEHVANWDQIQSHYIELIDKLSGNNVTSAKLLAQIEMNLKNRVQPNTAASDEQNKLLKLRVLTQFVYNLRRAESLEELGVTIKNNNETITQIETETRVKYETINSLRPILASLRQLVEEKEKTLQEQK